MQRARDVCARVYVRACAHAGAQFGSDGALRPAAALRNGAQIDFETVALGAIGGVKNKLA